MTCPRATMTIGAVDWYVAAAVHMRRRPVAQHHGGVVHAYDRTCPRATKTVGAVDWYAAAAVHERRVAQHNGILGQ